MACKFEIGDEVGVTSGGPRMTVIGINKDLVTCTWGNGKSGDFPESELGLIKKKDDNTSFQPPIYLA